VNLHFHYDQLNELEKLFVDCAVREIFAYAKAMSRRLNGDDSCERAVDALARWIIESRAA